ncbi:PatB family C-S lyase [Candidatus Bipolaricaulota bacterium]|nr:PatB family C-S lyase [Candidatus Bipolaricaulota bacterium]
MSRVDWFDCVIDRRGHDSTKWQAYGEDILPMWVADMDFASPPAVIEALESRVRHGVFGYPTECAGLRAAVVEWLWRRHSWRISEQDIVFLPNVVVGFNLAARAVCRPGDGIIYQPPVYFPILRVPEHSDTVAQPSPLVDDGNRLYRPDLKGFRMVAGPKTGLFLLCNPHNPVGRVFTPEELAGLAEICLENDIAICSDEIHGDLVYNDHRHVPIASLSPEIEARTITLIAPSKTFNVAGMGLAMAIIPNRTLRERFEASRKGLVPSPPALGYTAALAAYVHGETWHRELVAYLERNRDFLSEYIESELPGVSVRPAEATFLAWLDCRALGLTRSPHLFFLEQARVAMNDGASFGPGGEGFVRLNFGCPRSQLEEALDRMRRALNARNATE